MISLDSEKGEIKHRVTMKWPFYLFMLLILTEYLGLGYRVEIINTLHLPWIISIVILISIKSKYGFSDLFKSSQFKILLIFIVWTSFATVFALISYRAYTALKAQVGYFLLFIIAYFMFLDLGRIKKFLFVILLIHAFVVLGNLDHLLSGIRSGSLGTAYFLGDGNDLAWSLLTFLPFSFYFMKESRTTLGKAAAAFMGVVILGGIILTGSRGATIAVAAVFTYLAFTGKNKVVKVGLLCLLAMAIISVAPGTYMERIESIENYQDDSSAKGRIMAWKASLQMAIDYPLGVGAGNFPSVYGRFYRNDFADHTVYASNRWIKPHSIYFLVLAEYGFLGLGLLLCLLLKIFLQNRQSMNIFLSRAGGHAVPSFLPTCLQGSIVGFCAGGVFLGGLNYPAIYLLCALTLGIGNIIKNTIAIES